MKITISLEIFITNYLINFRDFKIDSQDNN